MCVGDKDQSRETLSSIENILLWSMRAWVMGIGRGLPVAEKIEAVYGRVGAPEAPIQIYELMWIIGHGATRTLNVDCVCKRRVSGDERTLLDIVGLYQHGRSLEALVLLRTLVRPNAAMVAGLAASEIARILLAAGQRLPAPYLPTTQYALTNRESQVLHDRSVTFH
jgi:hypothetical protein